MNTKEIDALFQTTLDDGRVSRAEKDALIALLDGLNPTPDQLAQLRSRAFAAAMERATDEPTRALLGWLEDIVKIAARSQPPARVAEACFSPGTTCLETITRLLGHAQRRADICVFTITDDRIADQIVAAHERGVRIRILTDDDKSLDLGSDIRKLAREGIDIAVDDSPHHMHHKFALFDEATLLTGSYNWTRSAASDNLENLLVTDDPRLVRAFIDTFERLWRALYRPHQS